MGWAVMHQDVCQLEVDGRLLGRQSGGTRDFFAGEANSLFEVHRYCKLNVVQ